MIMGLLYTPWLIRSLGRDDFGLYTLAGSVIGFFMFDFGLSNAITRFISKYLAEGRLDKANNCIGLVYKLYLFIDLVFLIILTSIYFFIPDIYQKLTPEEVEKFKIIYVIASVYSIIAFPFIPLNGILSANEKFVPMQIADLAQKIIMVSFMSICLLMGMGLYALVSVNALAGVFAILFKLIVIRKCTMMKVNFGYKNKSEFKEIITFSGWSTIVSVSQRFTLTIVPSVLGIFSGSAAIAIFGIAMTIEGYAYTFSSVIGGPFLPKVSRVVTREEEGLMPLMIKVGRIQYIAVGAIVLGFTCLGGNFVNLWVGDDFKDSFLCATLMIAVSFLSTPETIANQAILAKNKIKAQAMVYLATVAISIILLCIMAKLLGAVGAAVSICVVYFIRWFLMNIVYYRKLQINVLGFYKDTLFRMSPAFLIVLLTGIVLNVVLSGATWWQFIIKGSIFACIYIISIYVVLNTYEKNLFLNPVKKLWTKKY